jgi:hypothetical protein
MSKLGIGHGRLLIILGAVLAKLSPGLSVIPGAEMFCSTALHLLSLWTIASLVTAFAYLGARRILRG